MQWHEVRPGRGQNIAILRGSLWTGRGNRRKDKQERGTKSRWLQDPGTALLKHAVHFFGGAAPCLHVRY